MILKKFKQITTTITESFNRGDRVQRKNNLRHIGTVYQVSHSKEGSHANVDWDNGWKEFKLPFGELSAHKGEALPDKQNKLIGLLKTLHRKSNK